MTRAKLPLDTKTREGGGVTSMPRCVFFLSSLQVPSQFDFAKRSLFFHPVSIRLLPLTFLVPPGLSLFSLHSPSRETRLSYVIQTTPPPPPLLSTLTTDQIYADEDVTTCCEGGGLCVHTRTVCGKGYANGSALRGGQL